MSVKRRPGLLDMKSYYIPLILISGFFFVSSFFVLGGVENYFYRLHHVEAARLAKSYAHSISRLKDAESIINSLLKEKISLVAKASRYLEKDISDELLKSLAEDFDVDEIDYYSEEGVLIYSNIEGLKGWTIYPGHPIDVFLKGDANVHVEEIRQDAITGDHYKYGYLRLEGDRLLQVGIKANKVQEFMSRFSIDMLLDEMKSDGEALHIHILDQDIKVLAATDTDQKGVFGYRREDVKKALMEKPEYSYLYDEDGLERYRIIVPLHLKGNEAYLSVSYPLDDTHRAMKQISLFGLGALSVTFVSLVYSMFVSYRKNKSLHKRAYFDPLTDLPNKAHLEHEIDYFLRIGKNKGALMIVNIVSFRKFNASYGYHFGDDLVQAVKKRMKEITQAPMELFSFSIDRFALLLCSEEAEEVMKAQAEKTAETFRQPIIVEGTEVFPEIKAGIVLFDGNYNSVNRILTEVSVALEDIRDKDQSYTVFNEKMYETLKRKDNLLKEIRSAIETKDTGSLYLQYQPIINAADGKIRGFEALARMISKTYGAVSPGEFIDLAERNMLMIALGDYIFDLAFACIKNIEHEMGEGIVISVNVSGIQLVQAGFVERMIGKLEKSGISPRSLEIEITESVLLGSYDLINDRLLSLRDRGISIALDDFGTGYSSFSGLQDLNIDTLKIDRDFIERIGKGNTNLITEDLIRMAHRYQLKVVAEGVENEIQTAYLFAHGCDYLQGYLYSRAVAEAEAIRMLKAEQADKILL